MTIHGNHDTSRDVAPIAQSEEQRPSNQPLDADGCSVIRRDPFYGGIGPISPAAEARFWSKVDRSGSCWQWTGSVTSKGYGCFGVATKPKLAHRVSYALAGGVLDSTLTIDHLCRNKLCVRPDHLEQVPNRTNSRRYADTITHCKQGHSLTGDNLRVDTRGKRVCKACARVASRKATDRHRLMKPLAKVQPEARVETADDDHALASAERAWLRTLDRSCP